MAGCGSRPPTLPDTVEFSGTVSLDGEALPDALVTFLTPEGKKGVPYASAVTDDSGRYELKVAIGRTEKPGALPGDYKVTINRTFMTLDPSSPPPIPLLEKYTLPLSTELKATVPDDGGTQDFELKSK